MNSQVNKNLNIKREDGTDGGCTLNKKLSATRIYRGGATARALEIETSSVYIGTTGPGVAIFFGMNSKGGGTSEVLCEIKPDDFPALIGSMMSHDREVSMRAMSAELAREVAAQPIWDGYIARDAILSVLEAAREKCQLASKENAALEKFVLDRVDKLIKEEIEKRRSLEVTDMEPDSGQVVVRFPSVSTPLS